jgi:indolepyruvate ferredoxin oxidoreductase, beta subunit
MVTNVLLSGVGGQGIITASRALAEAALMAGCAIKKSEIHGMSQRGGNVESHVRYSADSPVYSPTIPYGQVDYLLAFEGLEALRALPLTRPDALVLADDRKIIPMTVTSGLFEYPQDPVGQLMGSGRRVQLVRCFSIACEVGEPRAANVVMLGAVSSHLGFAPEIWEVAIRRSVPAKALERSLRAFRAGLEAAQAAGLPSRQ